jgi:transposase
LPAYCPHLNPIERLWEILQAHLTHNRSYTAQKQFANAILPCLRKTIPKNGRIPKVRSQTNFASSLTKTFGFWCNRSIIACPELF